MYGNEMSPSERVFRSLYDKTCLRPRLFDNNSRYPSSYTYLASAGVAISVCTPMAIGTAPQWMLPNSSAMATP